MSEKIKKRVNIISTYLAIISGLLSLVISTSSSFHIFNIRYEGYIFVFLFFLSLIIYVLTLPNEKTEEIYDEKEDEETEKKLKNSLENIEQGEIKEWEE